MRKKRVLFLTALALVAFIGSAALLQPPPRAATRRGLSPDEIQRVRAASPAFAADWNEKFLQRVGVASKLNPQQLAYYRARGTDEMYLLRYLAEAGITPAESAELEPLGVRMALANPSEMGAGHWAALSNVVAIGEVEAVRANTVGPYRSSVDLRVTRYLKDDTNRRSARITGVLLLSGFRQHDGHVHEELGVGDEPDILVGERVVLFLSRAPLRLVSHFGSTLANHDGGLPKAVVADHGSHADLVRALDNPQDLEILSAYKIVQDQAVMKLRAFREPTPDELIDLATLSTRVEQVAAAQERGRRRNS